MSTPTRLRRSPTTAGGRFGRPAGMRSRHSPQRRMVAGGRLQRRRPPKPSTLQRVMGGKGGKAGGMAVLAGAAGMLFKNRDKLRRRRDKDAPLS